MAETETLTAPPGWTMRTPPETFGMIAGPFYFRDDLKSPGVGFISEPRHNNLMGVVHGGAIATLADMALFDICWRAAGERFPAVTVALNTEFLNAAPIGAFIEAGGELTRAGKSLQFICGFVRTEDKPIATFSGILKRLRG